MSEVIHATLSYTAIFTPQAWVNDQAIEVDPEGETTFDITPEVEKLKAKGLPVPQADTNDSDDFQFAAAAPQWIKDWRGPFYITIDEQGEEP